MTGKMTRQLGRPNSSLSHAGFRSGLVYGFSTCPGELSLDRAPTLDIIVKKKMVASWFLQYLPLFLRWFVEGLVHKHLPRSNQLFADRKNFRTC
jgi:hypothetical protein